MTKQQKKDSICSNKPMKKQEMRKNLKSNEKINKQPLTSYETFHRQSYENIT